MFDNVGEKIQTCSVIWCVFGMIGSVVGCALSMLNGSFMIGCLILIIGMIVSYISSLFTFGFGELIESQSRIEFYLANAQQTQPKASYKESNQSWVCKRCGKHNLNGNFCEGCGCSKKVGLS